MATRYVEGETIDVGFDGKRCIHSRNCVLGDPKVFEPNAPGQWIHPESGSMERIVAIAESCPSGAITYRRKDSGPAEAPPPVNTARLREKGPLAIHADLEVAGETMLRATLCRCGASQRKPYCDGSHAKVQFMATGEPGTRDALTFSERGGRVTITPQINGCLKVEGNVEIVSGTGRMIDRVRRAFLCRCGHSKDKPFCDGSHKAADFVA